MEFSEQSKTGRQDGANGVAADHRLAEPGHVAAGVRRWWKLYRREVIHADRYLNVLVNRDKVVLVGPPSEFATRAAQHGDELSIAVRFVAEQARK